MPGMGGMGGMGGMPGMEGLGGMGGMGGMDFVSGAGSFCLLVHSSHTYPLQSLVHRLPSLLPLRHSTTVLHHRSPPPSSTTVLHHRTPHPSSAACFRRVVADTPRPR
jgi:hypothetical protein